MAGRTGRAGRVRVWSGRPGTWPLLDRMPFRERGAQLHADVSTLAAGGCSVAAPLSFSSCSLHYKDHAAPHLYTVVLT